MNKDIAIRAKNLTKAYKLYNNHADRVKEALNPFRKSYHRVFNALSDVSLVIQRGETVGIIGRNGSGKSTLLQIVAGILQPTHGDIYVNGRISALLELGAGFNPEFSGRQNVFINAAILGLSYDEIEIRFSEIAAFANIGDYIDQPVKTYSSGMYVRLAFAIAINVNPDILIVDEALAVGDTLFQTKCFAKFREFQEKGVTVVFVTHSLDLVTRYCSGAYLLEQGRLIYSGAPKKVVDEYNRLIVNCSKMASYEVIESIGSECMPEEKLLSERQWEGLFKINPKENRYGNGNAKIVEAGIFTPDGNPVQTLIKGEWYNFRLKTRFNDTINNPIFAYTIKDVKGFDITGTNTLFQNIDTGIYHDGDVVLSEFKQQISLGQGGYLLSFGCAGHKNGEYIVYERRYDYLAFDVISKQGNVGFFDLNSEITLKKL
jgi:teichoic acid transport system ATP-binding protein